MSSAIRERIKKREKEKVFHAKFMDNHVDVEWLEKTIRLILHGYKNEVHDPDSALRLISDALGVETVGGYVLR